MRLYELANQAGRVFEQIRRTGEPLARECFRLWLREVCNVDVAGPVAATPDCQSRCSVAPGRLAQGAERGSGAAAGPGPHEVATQVSTPIDDSLSNQPFEPELEQVFRLIRRARESVARRFFWSLTEGLALAVSLDAERAER